MYLCPFTPNKVFVCQRWELIRSASAETDASQKRLVLRRVDILILPKTVMHRWLTSFSEAHCTRPLSSRGPSNLDRCVRNFSTVTAIDAPKTRRWHEKIMQPNTVVVEIPPRLKLSLCLFLLNSAVQKLVEHAQLIMHGSLQQILREGLTRCSPTFQANLFEPKHSATKILRGERWCATGRYIQRQIYLQTALFDLIISCALFICSK